MSVGKQGHGWTSTERVSDSNSTQIHVGHVPLRDNLNLTWIRVGHVPISCRIQIVRVQVYIQVSNVNLLPLGESQPPPHGLLRWWGRWVGESGFLGTEEMNGFEAERNPSPTFNFKVVVVGPQHKWWVWRVWSLFIYLLYSYSFTFIGSKSWKSYVSYTPFFFVLFFSWLSHMCPLHSD